MLLLYHDLPILKRLTNPIPITSLSFYGKIPSLTLLKIKNAHKERGCALCEHFLFGFNVCYIFFTVILIFLSSLSLLA